MCEHQPRAFVKLSLFACLCIFVLTLLNMIFAAVYPEEDFFKEPKLLNYDFVTSQSYLTDFNFNESYGDIKENYDRGVGYGITGTTKQKCVQGFCDQSSKRIYNKNCSYACLFSENYCYVNDQKCSASCSNSISGDGVSGCVYYNKIYYWKGYSLEESKDFYNFSVLNDTVPYNEECHNGYKQCGFLNEEKDKLCVKSYIECPINKIVVKDNNENPPTDFNYTERKLGDKYFYYTNEDVNNFIFLGFFADSDINNYYKDYDQYMEVVENDSIHNFLQYNPYLYDGKYKKKSEEELSKIGKAYLKLIKKANIKTLETFKNLQNIYIKHKTLYTEKILNEMNTKLLNKRGVLLGFGISIFSSFVGIFFFVILIYIGVTDGGKNCSCFKMNPWRNTILFYLIYLPTIILIIISFILTCIQKNDFETYSEKEYIKEYYTFHTYNNGTVQKNVYYFNDGEVFNFLQFICLLLAMIIMAIHLFLMYLIYGLRIWVNDSTNIDYNNNASSANYAVQSVQQPLYYQPPPPHHHHPHGPGVEINFQEPHGLFSAGVDIRLPHGFI